MAPPGARAADPPSRARRAFARGGAYTAFVARTGTCSATYSLCGPDDDADPGRDRADAAGAEKTLASRGSKTRLPERLRARPAVTAAIAAARSEAAARSFALWMRSSSSAVSSRSFKPPSRDRSVVGLLELQMRPPFASIALCISVRAVRSLAMTDLSSRSFACIAASSTGATRARAPRAPRPPSGPSRTPRRDMAVRHERTEGTLELTQKTRFWIWRRAKSDIK